ncbi:MAG: PHP domain-containing protein [Oscillospiraceae bacterium]|nr:PHP domain-containing protein [Oscillospiraceae bacterium]
MKTKKLTAIILSALMLSAFIVPGINASAASGRTFLEIKNPYETVDFGTWNRYKTELHAHTLYSDGSTTISDSVEEYYAQGYDILAITDHGVINRGWNVKPQLVPILGYQSYINVLKPVPQDRYEEITVEGKDRGGRIMLDVDRGIELNAAVLTKTHINGFFCEYGQSYWGKEYDYETSAKGVDKAGGLSFINHPSHPILDKINNVEDALESNDFLRFADLFTKYENSLIGLEAYNDGDSGSKGRLVWDGVLQVNVPRGKNVWGFANSDSHKLETIGSSSEVFLMPENTNEALRTAMENGTFYICSKWDNTRLGGEGLPRGNGNYAKINDITVDNSSFTITLDVTSDLDDHVIEWVTNYGKIIATGSALDLCDPEVADEVGFYVRAQIINEGGIVCTQPFVIDDGTLDSLATDLTPPDTTGNAFLDALMRLFNMFYNSIFGALIRMYIIK